MGVRGHSDERLKPLVAIMCELVAPYKIQTLKDVPADAFITAFAQHLKSTGKFITPEWTAFVKTGVAKELAPYDADWFFIRAAAIARRVYVNPEVGVGAFKKIFGTQKRNGGRRNHSSEGSGKINRVALQQLEKLGYLAKSKNGGRIVSKEGQQKMDYVAAHSAAPIAQKYKMNILATVISQDA
jgi:small subunit ribosomal protein S19e